MNGSTRDRGRAVEAEVAAFLTERGLRILERNFAGYGAEIDLIAIDAQRAEPEYVFVEVRSRAYEHRGTALETIDLAKQRRIIRGATGWLLERGLWEHVAVRFDVVGVSTPPGAEPEIEWLEDAFRA